MKNINDKNNKTISPTLNVAGNLTVSGKTNEKQQIICIAFLGLLAQTNSTIGNFTIGQYNASCAGFRFGQSGGWLLSCT
ncbi:MAG: hypothetical protein ABIA04_04045 [Pseudomonadota bacterium]